jgi:beta-N-acetylhexosaminidase
MGMPAHRTLARVPAQLARVARLGRVARRRIVAVAAGAVAVGLAAGCGGGPGDPAHSASATTSASASHTAARDGMAAAPSPSPSPSVSCPATVLASMTEAQRVGQLFLVGLPDNEVAGTVAETITAHHFGSVIFGADSKGGITGARQVAGAVQALTSKSATDGVRFFVAANQEGGEVQALTGPGISEIPSALDQGSVAPRALTSMASAWGDQLRSAGVNLNLAPVLDVVPAGTERSNAPIGALDREYGNDPATVSAHGVAFLRGMASAGIATSAKHFPGLGRVTGNTDFTSSVVDTVTAATSSYLQTYQAAINAGVPMVMVALATYTRIDPHELAVFSPTIVDGLLRQRMHFTGTILSDDMGVAAAVASISPGQRAISFVSAGGDLITTESLPVADEMDAALLARAATSSTFRAQVDAAALHVLTTKQAYGLLPCGK